MIAEDLPNRCNDCGQPSHPYMVYDSLWKKIGGPNFLCIPCFERRMGRALTQRDLIPDTAVNAWMRWVGGTLLPCEAGTAWTMLRIATRRFGWNGLNADLVEQALVELKESGIAQG